MVATLCTVWKDYVNNKAKQRYTALDMEKKEGGERKKNNYKNKDKNKHVGLPCLKPHTL